MPHKTKLSLGFWQIHIILNSSCISLPQNGYKSPNTSSCQLNALTHAKCWIAYIKHLLKHYSTAAFSATCERNWHILSNYNLHEKVERWVSGFYGSLRWQKWSNCWGKVLTAALTKWKIMILCSKRCFSSARQVCLSASFLRMTSFEMCEPIRMSLFLL